MLIMYINYKHVNSAVQWYFQYVWWSKISRSHYAKICRFSLWFEITQKRVIQEHNYPQEESLDGFAIRGISSFDVLIKANDFSLATPTDY
ncbi:unnamed protein product [Acanthoscelides obtectus]|uniref:Uncharacterized protein n=1 Tax=Acanthoscelides obtectus TaxID=200917 RepID=A0A9P0PYI9_ACAOB|nr:unnamed protein product [Acanthoscelides obtectus]CAK1642401.1 hypothetical protein AOBTE_LOCUS13014 [Acanthoscelides obtectus]